MVTILYRELYRYLIFHALTKAILRHRHVSDPLAAAAGGGGVLTNF
jgi:uncharacterized membrane protein YhfC